MRKIEEKWPWFLLGTIFFVEAVILFAAKDSLYVGICDNLDLFIAQLKMLRDNHAFFGKDITMPLMQNLDRDYFPSELSLYNLLYLIMPDLYAYIVGYLLKIMVSVVSCVLLARTLLREKYKTYEKAVALVATAFALLPLYPMYGVCFASIPLLVVLLVEVYRKPKWWHFAAIFAYPFVSYFSFFGAFLLGYLLIALLILGIRDKKVSMPLVGAFFCLMAGYVVFEHRLFSVMFFSEEETIRSTMVIANFDGRQLWDCFIDVLLHGIPHAVSAHMVLVLPVCLVYFVGNNVRYIRNRDAKGCVSDLFNLTILFIVFNAAVYALYFWEPLRGLIEQVVPPLKGFQYGRTIFFNTFAWYFAFFLVLKKLYDRKHQKIALALAVLSILVVGATQTEYSDFYNTCYCNLYKLVKHTDVNQLSYSDFYAESLFEKIKEDLAYDAEEGACAYGLHPATLGYNGITTVDGYCGYYTQAYKEKFQKVIQPTLELQPRWETYFNDWGCRAYLFPASGENLYDFGENSPAEPHEIHVNEEELKKLGCKYIFSRVEISNAQEENLEYRNTYQDEQIPYQVYVYELR